MIRKHSPLQNIWRAMEIFCRQDTQDRFDFVRQDVVFQQRVLHSILNILSVNHLSLFLLQYQNQSRSVPSLAVDSQVFIRPSRRHYQLEQWVRYIDLNWSLDFGFFSKSLNHFPFMCSFWIRVILPPSFYLRFTSVISGWSFFITHFVPLSIPFTSRSF